MPTVSMCEQEVIFVFRMFVSDTLNRPSKQSKRYVQAVKRFPAIVNNILPPLVSKSSRSRTLKAVRRRDVSVRSAVCSAKARLWTEPLKTRLEATVRWAPGELLRTTVVFPTSSCGMSWLDSLDCWSRKRKGRMGCIHCLLSDNACSRTGSDLYKRRTRHHASVTVSVA